MSDETKEILQVPTEAELTASGPVAQSSEEADKMLAEDKTKSKKSKAKHAKGKEATGALHAIGLAACQRHGLKCVWVTEDDQESNARAHAKNLGGAAPLKVEA